MAGPIAIKVYKNEDVNNPEYATVEEVRRAFFWRGVFIKQKNGDYDQVTGFNPDTGYLYAGDSAFTLAEPT